MQNYVKTVEAVSLKTLGRLAGTSVITVPSVQCSFNIYDRKFKDRADINLSFELKDIIFLSDPCWKIVWEDFIVDEYSHTDKSTIKGVECWPEFGSLYTIRQENYVEIDDGFTYFLMGSDRNHYHMVLNFLPRLMVFQKTYGQVASESIRFVVDGGLSTNAIRLLEIFGVPRNQIFFAKPKTAYNFKHAIVANFFPSYEISPDVAEWLQERTQAYRRSGTRKRVFLSRDDAAGQGFGNGTQRRRVCNQGEVIAQLDQYNFQKFDFGKMSMDEQLEVAANCEIVIGPHGAGFANFACSDPGTKAVVFENSWNHTFMADMLNVSGCDANVFLCEDFIDSSYEERNRDSHNYNEIKRNRDMIVPMDEFIVNMRRLFG